MSEPKQVQKRAIDVTPNYHGVWCQVGDGEPFMNTIELRRWSRDGESISFMLDSHNFMSARPDELIDVVEIEPRYITPEMEKRDRETMAVRPVPTRECTRCGGRGQIDVPREAQSAGGIVRDELGRLLDAHEAAMVRAYLAQKDSARKAAASDLMSTRMAIRAYVERVVAETMATYEAGES